MKRYFYLLGIFLLLAANFQTARGQSTEDDKKRHEREIDEQIKRARETNNQRINTPTIRDDNSQDAIFIARQREVQNRRKEREEYLTQLNIIRAPHPADLEKYQFFLRQKDTGLFKLFPDLGCNSRGIIKVDGDCENAVNDSYFYSFQGKNYYGGGLYDIRLGEGKLWLDGFLSQGIITEVGDVALENISLQNNYASFLVGFQPSNESVESKKQFWQIAEKVKSNGYSFGKVVNPVINTTYLARFINYRLDENFIGKSRAKQLTEKDQQPFFLLSHFSGKRADTIVAFRIVRIDSDNSLTILWKQFAETKSPKLKFAKNEKWTDLKVK